MMITIGAMGHHQIQGPGAERMRSADRRLGVVVRRFFFVFGEGRQEAADREERPRSQAFAGPMHGRHEPFFIEFESDQWLVWLPPLSTPIRIVLATLARGCAIAKVKVKVKKQVNFTSKPSV